MVQFETSMGRPDHTAQAMDLGENQSYVLRSDPQRPTEPSRRR